MRTRTLAVVAVLLPLALALAQQQPHQSPQAEPRGTGSAVTVPPVRESTEAELQKHVEQMRKVVAAVAVIRPTQGSRVSGVVWFSQQDDDTVRVVAELENLPPDSTHGFHIHEYGDATSSDGSSAGSHYNPAGHPHGLPDGAPRHAGDLGNIRADAEGHAHYEATIEGVSIARPLNPILGRSVVVHEKPDDGSQPTGNAGGRIGVGVIGVANPASQPPAAQATEAGAPKPPPAPIDDHKH